MPTKKKAEPKPVAKKRATGVKTDNGGRTVTDNGGRVVVEEEE